MTDESPWVGATPTKVTLTGQAGKALDDNAYVGDRDTKTGKFLLEGVDPVNLVCVLGSKPTDTVSPAVLRDLLAYCVQRGAMLIVDSPPEWTHDDVVTGPEPLVMALGLDGPATRNAALYYPRLRETDPARGVVTTYPSCGAVSGVIAGTDATRGVWKAPAGTGAPLTGVLELSDALTDSENAVINTFAINALRAFPTHGTVVWVARTMRGSDQAADEYKYLPVRRMALFLEQSLSRGVHWVVFEPNDEPPWAQIRLNVGAFMHSLRARGLPRDHAARRLLRQVRQSDDHPGRPQQGNRQHRRRLRPAQAG